ncbi:hypothetical protein BDZ97DRAFT_1669794, partial [Flammula alnicola]
LLELSDYFVSPSTREFALDQIQAHCFHFDAPVLIELSYRYHTRIFFRSAFERLVKMPLHKLTEKEEKLLGDYLMVVVAKVKESILESRQIIACEAPEIKHHYPDCANNVLCESDWYAIWWNGMGRFLLDGRHELSWDEAISRFENMQFGDVGEGCRKAMILQLKQGDAYRQGENLIKITADELASRIQELDGSL